MADQYGVVPVGFSRKTLGVNLAEIETGMVGLFGADVAQDAQSVLGQLNGLVADLVTDMWEIAEDVYQSFDVDQAQGPRLDMLAKMRRMQRADSEQDADFQWRITNQGQADISLTANIGRLKEIAGVTWVSALVNSTDESDALGLPAHAVAYAVIGGDDAEVGLAIYQMTVGGISLFGNTVVPVIADGYCQSVRFIRPIDVPISVAIEVLHVADAANCAPPTTGTITAAIIAAFAGDDGYRNGSLVTADRVALPVGRAGDLKVVTVAIARGPALDVEEEITTSIFERPVIISPYVEVRYV